jgi:two-component system sensor kinase FixL
MNWVTVIWSMVASACLTLALVYLMVWFQKRSAWSYLLFSLAAIGTAGVSFFEVSALNAKTVAEYGLALRWAHIPFWVLLLSLVGFVRVYMRAGRLWLAWMICGLRTMSLMLNFIFTPNINYREITGLRHVWLLGESVSVAEGIPNPWMLTGQISLVLFLIYLVDATCTMWRRGERRSMLLLSSTMAFFMATALGQFLLTFWGISPRTVTFSFYFLGVVAVMAWEMSRETIRAAQLSDDLSKKDEWLNMAADTAGVGLWLWDFKTNLLWATERARLMYGFVPDDPIPFDTFLARLHPDDLDWVVQASQKCIREGTDFRNDYRIVLDDGSIRLMHVLAKAFINPAGVPERMTGVAIDITERKNIELALLQKHNELNHISRVSTMGQLASTLAHEINQPLGAILRNAEAAELIMQEPSPDLDEIRAILEDIRKDDQRAGEVIDRIRNMMKPQKSERCQFDLNVLIGESLAMVKSDADKRQVRLTLDFDTSLPPVYGDRVQLQQVLINLLVNALDALSENLPPNPLVSVCARNAGDSVVVDVFDNGSGITADKLPHVFEPFFSSKANGLGMGLAISKGIIEAHGGRIWAANSEAGGVTFTVSLPSATGEAAT